MAKREYRASGRYDYFAVDEYHEGDSGTHGDPLIFRTKKLAVEVANRLNEAYAAGETDGQNQKSCVLCNPGTPDEIRQREQASMELDRLIVEDEHY